MNEFSGLANGRNRRGEMFIAAKQRFPLEQEVSLELPLAYSPEVASPSRVAAFFHAFHLELLPEVRAYLGHIPFPADLFVSTDTDQKREIVAAAFANWPAGRVTVTVVPNRGRDVAPKLYGFGGAHYDYEYVLHVHTKQSPHDDRLAGWRGYLYETLLGSPEVIRGVFAAFAACPTLGLLAPQHVDELRPWIRWGMNHKLAEALAQRMGFPLPLEAPLDFPSGSMFWARTAALKPLLDLKLGFYDFPAEAGQTDGTLAHAIERLYFLVCEEAGFSWMKITAKGQLHEQAGTVAINGPDQLARFLRQDSIKLTDMRKVQRFGREQPTISSAPQQPRRIMHVLWRRALGTAAAWPEGWHTVVILHGRAANDAALASDMRREMTGAGGNPVTDVVVDEMVSAREALERGFACGADLVVLLDQPGMVFPDSIGAIQRMASAHGGCALLEAARIPNLRPKQVDPTSFAVAWAGGPLLAVTKAAFEQLGNFDERLCGQAAELDLSWRARAGGVPVLYCANALFYPLDDTPGPAWPDGTGTYLAHKWGHLADRVQPGEGASAESLTHHWKGVADLSPWLPT